MDDPRALAQKMFFSKTRGLEEKRSKEVKTALGDLNKKGLFKSGRRYVTVYEINKKYLLELPLQIKLDIEKDLINKGLQEPDDQLNEVIKTHLRRFVRDIAYNDLIRATDDDFKARQGDPLHEQFHERIRSDTDEARAHYFNEVDILIPLSQAEAKMKEEPTSMNITYKITGMANFGQVIGDIEVNVQQIKESGHEEIAQALAELTEVIANDPKLIDDDKSQAIGQMQELSQQVKVEKESRNKGVIEAILTHLPTLMILSDKCQELWVRYEPIIRGFLKGE